MLSLWIFQSQHGTSQKIEIVTRDATQWTNEPKEVLDLWLDPVIQLKWLFHLWPVRSAC